MRVAPEIELGPEEKQRLTQLSNSNTAAVREARRAAIVLLAAGGKTNHAIADALNIGRVQVGRWRARYAQGGIAAIRRDRPRGGRPKTVDASEIVRLTTQTTPPDATHWSSRTLAAHTGVSPASVLRVWAAHGLKPHRMDTFKVSRDP